MTSAPVTTPLCQEAQGLLAFTVDVGDRQVGAFLSEAVWNARLARRSDVSLTERYQSHRAFIDEAVVRRVRAGARDPVVLRPSDL